MPVHPDPRLLMASRGRVPVRGLLSAVVLLSLGLIVVTGMNCRTALRVTEETLRNRGVSIGLELAAEARRQDARDGAALQALVTGQRWREVAFLAIIDRDGTALAHTNPRLARTLLDDTAFRSVRDTGRLEARMITLGTGEEVYELTAPFHVPPAGPGGMVDAREPRFRVLRLALHTAPARRIVYQARAQVLFVSVLVLVLLGLSVWQARTLRRYVALQQEAARQERLAALGEMAAVLAHEIRNPLGAIKGLAQFLGEKHSGDPTQSEMTQTIAGEATRLERLVSDLLTYARPRPPDRRPVDLTATLREVVALAQPAAESAHVKVELGATDGLPSILADPEQVKQLFDNLVLNAIQAMASGGTLRIGFGGHAPGRAWTRKEQGSGVGERDAAESARATGPARRWVAISVEDTGPGIVETDLPRLFEPFYTTRTKGTGLGLAICRQTVGAHGGSIRVARTGPEGTRIEVTLPREAPTHG